MRNERQDTNGYFRLFCEWIKRLWKSLSQNFSTKMLSLVIAILLWNYVISANTSITRVAMLRGITGNITGQSTLNTYNRLALLTDPTPLLENISVEIEVPLAEFAYVSPANVQVSLDLSGVRQAGTQQVPIKAVTAYGRVLRTIPDAVALTVEPMDSRSVPVNVEMQGGGENGYWHKQGRINPSVLTISGASSLVRSIASAYAYVDVSNAKTTFTTAERYVLLDNAGNEIEQSVLNCSVSSVSVTVDAYPTKEIPISKELNNLITGIPADGYVVEDVTIQPETLTVAAEQELLDSIESLQIEPISVEGLSRSFNGQASVSALSSFKYISAEDVYFNVVISEGAEGGWVENVKVSALNKDESMQLENETENIRIYVTGPQSVVNKLIEDGLVINVDLKGLTAGEHNVPIILPTDLYPNVVFTPESDVVRVKLTEKTADVID